MKRYILTTDEAISLLPDSEDIHIFLNSGSALMGADHERQSVIRRIETADRVELAGDKARAMGHGLVIFPKNAKYQSDLYFVETDEKKLNALEPRLAQGEEA